MRIINKFITISILLLSISSLSQAASLYVTDRILLGVHQQASEDSPLIKSIASGTAVELLEKQANFTRVKLLDGTKGWVSSQYLMNEQPSTAQYDQLFAKHKKSMQTLKSVSATLTKRERDVQILRDQLSNAKTSIREAQKGGAVVAQSDPQEAQKLQAAEQRIQELTKELEVNEKDNKVTIDQNATQALLQTAEQENTALQARIALALSNLSGEQVPTPQELAAIRPSFPLWYWLFMLVALAVGGVAGIVWMDYIVRKRHGGFRV